MERNKIQVKGEYRMNYSELSLEELKEIAKEKADADAKKLDTIIALMGQNR